MAIYMHKIKSVKISFNNRDKFQNSQENLSIFIIIRDLSLLAKDAYLVFKWSVDYIYSAISTKK